MAASSSRKRLSPWQQQSLESEECCSYCKNQPAALLVSVPSLRKKRPLQERYCLLHYYTTDAVRSKPEDVLVINQSELEKQLPAMQSLFADVFVELKQELSETAARSFQANSRDPLAIISKLHKSSSRQQKPPPVRPKSEAVANGGGFIQHISLPERLVRTQQEQAQKQQTLVRRMEQASKNTATGNTHTQRRKPTRKSIWNVMEDAAFKPQSAAKTAEADTTTTSFLESNSNITCSSCGGNQVICLSSSTNRHNESTKGEIWGSGNRGDVVQRYQCQTCGKTWNEQE